MGQSGEQGSATVRGMYHLFLGNTTYTLLLALTAIIVGRILGPDGYGLYTIALIIPPFVFNAIRVGLDTAATRYAARLRSETREKEATLFVYAMVIFEVGLAVIFTAVFFGLSGVLASRVLNRPQIAGLILPVAMLSVVGQAAYTVTTSGLIGLGRYDRAAIFQALQGLSRLVVSVGLVLLGFGVLGAVTGYTAAFFVSGFLGILLVLSMSGAAIPKGLRVDLSTGVRYGWPVYLSIIVSAFVAPVLSIALALTVSNSQIGGYSVAGTFSSLIALFTYPVGTALFPLFSRSVGDVSALGGAFKASVKFTALLVLPVCFFIIALAGPLMVTFYGHAYSFAGYLLALFGVMNLVAGVGNLSWGAFLNGIGRTQDALIGNAIGSVVDIGVGIPLILAVGVSGAILGQVVGGVVGLAIGMWMVARQLHAGLGLRSVWKLWLSAGVAAVVCYPISGLVRIPQLAVVLGAAVFVFLFVTMLAGARALTEEDIGALRGYLGFSAIVSRPLEVAIRYYEAMAKLGG